MKLFIFSIFNGAFGGLADFNGQICKSQLLWNFDFYGSTPAGYVAN